MDNCEYRSRIVCNTEGSLIKERFPKSSALSRIGGFRRSGSFLSFAFFKASRVVSMVRLYRADQLLCKSEGSNLAGFILKGQRYLLPINSLGGNCSTGPYFSGCIRAILFRREPASPRAQRLASRLQCRGKRGDRRANIKSSGHFPSREALRGLSSER